MRSTSSNCNAVRAMKYNFVVQDQKGSAVYLKRSQPTVVSNGREVWWLWNNVKNTLSAVGLHTLLNLRGPLLFYSWPDLKPGPDLCFPIIRFRKWLRAKSGGSRGWFQAVFTERTVNSSLVTEEYSTFKSGSIAHHNICPLARFSTNAGSSLLFRLRVVNGMKTDSHQLPFPEPQSFSSLYTHTAGVMHK